MRILIIEDEAQAAWNLQQSIKTVEESAEIIGVVDCVAGIGEWFATKEIPDLIFSDIQLGDGIVFDAFKKIEIPCPIIFCTAFDEYLLQAFKTNGIDYLLKPIDETEIKKSFEKLAILQKSQTPQQQTVFLTKAIFELLEQRPSYKTNFLVPHRDRLIPVETKQIAYFKVYEDNAEIALLNGQHYAHNYTLDYLASVLDPRQFHRVSRQYLLGYDAVHEIEHHDDRKLLVHLKEPCREKIIVSKAKVSEFLKWIQQR